MELDGLERIYQNLRADLIRYNDFHPDLQVGLDWLVYRSPSRASFIVDKLATLAECYRKAARAEQVPCGDVEEARARLAKGDLLGYEESDRSLKQAMRLAASPSIANYHKTPSDFAVYVYCEGGQGGEATNREKSEQPDTLVKRLEALKYNDSSVWKHRNGVVDEAIAIVKAHQQSTESGPVTSEEQRMVEAEEATKG